VAPKRGERIPCSHSFTVRDILEAQAETQKSVGGKGEGGSDKKKIREGEKSPKKEGTDVRKGKSRSTFIQGGGPLSREMFPRFSLESRYWGGIAKKGGKFSVGKALNIRRKT